MLVTALTSWIIGGIVGLIAFAAASYVSPRPRDEDLRYLSDKERWMRGHQWYKVGEVTRGFAGGTYVVAFLLLGFTHQCRSDPDSGELYCGGTMQQWGAIIEFLFLIVVGLLVGRSILERITGSHRKV
jgi:hypothetical protein